MKKEVIKIITNLNRGCPYGIYHIKDDIHVWYDSEAARSQAIYNNNFMIQL